MAQADVPVAQLTTNAQYVHIAKAGKKFFIPCRVSIPGLVLLQDTAVQSHCSSIKYIPCSPFR
jgi:hypothetical protein